MTLLGILSIALGALVMLVIGAGCALLLWRGEDQRIPDDVPPIDYVGRALADLNREEP